MSRRIRIKGLGLLLLCMGPFLWAQQAMSLEDAQNYAFKNSYLIKNSRHEIEKAEKRIWEITAIGLPQASASLNYQYSPDLPEQPVPAEFFGGEPGTFQTVAFGVSNSSVATFQINQLVFDGTYLLARQGSILLKKIRNDELTKSTIDVRDEVARAYYNVQLSAEAEKILQSNLDNLSKNLQEVRALYEEGFLEEQDAQQLEYLVNGISLELENARRMGKVAMDFFRFTIGMPMDSAVRLSQALEGSTCRMRADNGFRIRPSDWRNTSSTNWPKIRRRERPFRSKGKCGTLHPRSMAFSPTSRAISTTTVSICSITIPIGSHRL